MRRLLPLLAVIAVAGCGGDPREDITPAAPAPVVGSATHFAVKPIADGFNRPTYVGAAPGDDEALWVLEQSGRVIRLRGHKRTTVLDLRKQTKVGAEQGLLGIAFHPEFATNRLFYVHHSDRVGDTRVAEYRYRRGAPAQATRELLALEQPAPNHNGGQLAFGPDGRLYLGLGDGGGAFDPQRRAQDGAQLYGKIVALDVGATAADWQVVLTGLRNPWRFSFDFGLNELWIGDVGQDQIEEVNRVQLELDEPPKNLGWSAFEGTEIVEPGTDHPFDESSELVWPVASYTHASGGCSITGGVVYRGTRLPRLSGRYVYGDFCSGVLWSLHPKAGEGAEDVRRERAGVQQLTHIGTDSDGELLFASGAGQLLRAVAP